MELCDKYIHDYVLLNPTLNDFMKIKQYNHLRSKYPNFLSKEYDKREENLNKKYLKILDKKKEKTFYDQLFYSDLKEYFKEIDFPSEYFPLSYLDNYFVNILTDINSKDSQYSFTDTKSYEDYISRLKQSKKITKEMILNMKKGLKEKMTIPKIIIRGIIEQLEDLLKNNTYENKYNHFQKIPKNIEKKFLDTIRDYLILSIRNILSFLIEEYVENCRDTIGLCDLKSGKRLYENILKSYLTEDYSSENVHKIGLKEVNKNKKKLKDLQKKMKIKGDLSYFMFHMKKQNKKMKDKKEVLEELHKIRERLLKEVFQKYFDNKLSKKDLYKIKPVPKENKHMSAYYLLPDFKNERKGTFFINALNPELVNKYELPVLSAHEGIPGHHYENLKHSNEKYPLYVRITPYTAYSEGWALYCESLYKPKNNYELFWQIIYNLHRSIRLVIDTGIHYYGWSYDKCFHYMKKLLPLSDIEIKNEIYRYICDPGQALCYKIGELKLLELRDKYFKSYKEDYKNFHKLIMDIGPVPLDILEQEINRLL